MARVVDKTHWSKYIDATSDGAYNTAIAEAIGVDPATVGRWRTGAVDPKPRQVVAYARAFGQGPIAALIAAGYLTEAELDLPVSAPRAYTLDTWHAYIKREAWIEWRPVAPWRNTRRVHCWASHLPNGR